MVNDRQQAAEDLQRLTQQIRGTARELAGTQPGASSKLRGALNGMDGSDLNNARSGIPFRLRVAKLSIRRKLP